jgi:hypothetical protein
MAMIAFFEARIADVTDTADLSAPSFTIIQGVRGTRNRLQRRMRWVEVSSDAMIPGIDLQVIFPEAWREEDRLCQEH